MHTKNVEQSYSKVLANMLDVDLVNVALSGGSNDYIFFSTVEQILTTPADKIHSVVVAWTNCARLTWKCNDRYWMFIGPWATTIKSTTPDALDFPDWKTNVEHKDVWVNTDDTVYLDELILQHKFFVNNYLSDRQELSKKLSAYSTSINAICQQRNIKLVELAIYDSPPVTKPYKLKTPFKGHPTAEQHQLIAQELFNEFYKDYIN
jgi:hypothetical protein